MKTIFEQVIKRGNYDLTGLLKNIDRYHVEGKLIDSERDELYALARKEAVPKYDTMDEIRRLWAVVRDLRNSITQLLAALDDVNLPPEEENEDTWPAYVQPTGAHDAYHIGDQVTWRGEHYVCCMEGCVWDPDVYPAGWELAADTVPDGQNEIPDKE